MELYGQMLYAFVTDIQMQRTSPVFDMSTPEAVGDEYMELNELITELARYQQKADDRGARVDDSGAGREPLEDHLNKFYEDRSLIDKENLARANTAIISTHGLTPPPGPEPTPPGPAPPGPTPPGPTPPGPTPPGPAPPHTDWDPQGSPDPRINRDEPWSPHNDRRTNEDEPFGPNNDVLTPPDSMHQRMKQPGLFKTNVRVGSKEMDYGISRNRNPTQSGTSSSSSVPVRSIHSDDIIERRNKMYSMFGGR
jgi:hypothetical protein